jgi:hypothetical protein
MSEREMLISKVEIIPQDIADVEDAYREIAQRVGAE